MFPQDGPHDRTILTSDGDAVAHAASPRPLPSRLRLAALVMSTTMLVAACNGAGGTREGAGSSEADLNELVDQLQPEASTNESGAVEDLDSAADDEGPVSVDQPAVDQAAAARCASVVSEAEARDARGEFEPDVFDDEFDEESEPVLDFASTVADDSVAASGERPTFEDFGSTFVVADLSDTQLDETIGRCYEQGVLVDVDEGPDGDGDGDGEVGEEADEALCHEIDDPEVIEELAWFLVEEPNEALEEIRWIAETCGLDALELETTVRAVELD